MSESDEDWGLRAGLLLKELGFSNQDISYRYLTAALKMMMGGALPGPEMWLAIGGWYGKQNETVRGACRRSIRTAYERDPVNFCNSLDDLYFTPPRLREFLVIASKWLRQRYSPK